MRRAHTQLSPGTPPALSALVALGAAALLAWSEPVRAETASAAPDDAALEGDLRTPKGLEAAEAPPSDAPPARPYKKSVVLDTSIGALGFLGELGKVAPTAVWMHTQLGYELVRWFMVLGEAELAFTDTSKGQAPPQTRAFPILGGGAGVRFTARFGERLGIYVQGSAGGMKADIRVNALRNIGFGDAEALGLYYGGRVGVELYQVDRHFAIGVTGGARVAQGFAQTRRQGNDTPLLVDGGLSLRYAF